MLSIVINHYRTPELLRLCLDSLRKGLIDTPHEIIVRDGEAMDEVREFMPEDYPEVVYLPERENVGFALLVNEGLRRARGAFIAILNADIITPSTSALSELVAYLQSHPRVGMAGPRLLNMNGSVQPSCFRYYAPWTLLFRRTLLGKTPPGQRDIARFTYADHMAPGADPFPPTTTPFPVDWLMGSALLVRREALDAVGGFDERFFMYFEDVDWCRRFWDAGWEVHYVPSTTLYHYHGKASHGRRGIIDALTNRYTRVHIASAIRYFTKYGLAVPRHGA